MKVYYDASGKILDAVFDRDSFVYTIASNESVPSIEIDEIEANKDLCRNLGMLQEGAKRYTVIAGALCDDKGKPAAVAADATKTRLAELQAKGDLMTAQEQLEALKIVMGKTLTANR